MRMKKEEEKIPTVAIKAPKRPGSQNTDYQEARKSGETRIPLPDTLISW